MKKRERILNTFTKTGGLRNLVSKSLEKIKVAENQYTTPIKQTISRPSNTKGKDGDRQVFVENGKSYLVIKVNKRWMKLQLEEID